jgi:precorrin-3B synthase
MMAQKKTQIKGWCPSLEKPMETGDGLLVRIPIKFGLLHSDVAQKIAALSAKYGNGHLDLSARGNLQFRGVSEKTYEPLRAELAQIGFEWDFSFSIIANPLDKNAQKIAKKIYSALSTEPLALPEKLLIIIDGGGVFPLSAIPCDLYVASEQVDIQKILTSLKNVIKCHKKPANMNTPPAPIGFIPLTKQSGVVCIAATFGRIEAEELKKLADIAKKYGGGEIVFAPFRRIILPDIATEKQSFVLQELAEIGFITKAGDSRLNIHACVGAPACSSAYGETLSLAQKWAIDHPNLKQIVHITGCSKGCAYRGKADITITATKTGYETT